MILYVQEKGASFISPAAVYNPSSSVLTPSNLETLLALLFKPEDPVSNNQNLITDTIQYSGGGGHHNSSIEDEASTSTATTTDDTATSTATTTDDVATSTATSTEDIATSTDETATSTATTTEDIATSTATTTDPVEVIDIEAPEFMMEISNQCLNSSQTEICLLATTTVDFILTALSTDISFYTISIDGEEVATTSDELISMEFDPDNMYEVSIFATDNSDNISSSTLRTIDIYTHPVVINEVAWMGTATSTDDEWMELYNMTPYDIDLSGWTLNSADGTPHIDLEGEILAEDFYLLERTADTTISDITADLIYTGALGNGGEELILSFASSTVDQTPAGPWPFGDNTSKRTMERKDVTGAGSVGTNASSWINNDNWTYNGLDAGGNEIKGTPRSQNSSTVIMMI